MIYDCFTFYDELDLLEIRLETLSSYVDYFVLVEATQTFSGQPKPLYFSLNRKRFSKFLDRIIPVTVDDLNQAPIITNQAPFNKIELFQQNPAIWSKEFYQRNCLTRALVKSKDDDLILIGDVDEIPNPPTIKTVKFSPKPTIFEQDFYYYYLNCQSPENKINGTRGVYKKFLTTPQEIRIQTAKTSHVIKNGGWHFSYLGGFPQIINKIKSYSHQELNTPDINNLKRIKFNIDNNLDIFDRPFSYKMVKIDKNYPSYIFENKNKFKKYIKPLTKNSSNTLKLRQEILSDRQKMSNLNYDKRCLMQQIIDKDAQIERLKQQLFESDQTLTRIYNSRTWKLFLVYKRIASFLTH